MSETLKAEVAATAGKRLTIVVVVVVRPGKSSFTMSLIVLSGGGSVGSVNAAGVEVAGCVGANLLASLSSSYLSVSSSLSSFTSPGSGWPSEDFSGCAFASFWYLKPCNEQSGFSDAVRLLPSHANTSRTEQQSVAP